MLHRRLPLFALLGALTLLAPLAAQDGKPQTSDGLFTIEKEIARLPVQNQGMTGTCWSFATVSFVESEIERMTGRPSDLSEIYPVYFTWLEKSKRYVEKKGESQFTEGGLSHDITMVIRDYGLVPQEAYTGLCPGDKMHNHAEMAGVLKGMLDVVAKKKSRRGRNVAPSDKWMAATRGVLDAYLGRPPERFEVEGKEYTPKSYAASLGLDASNYVEIMSFKSQPMWSDATLDVPDNWDKVANYKNVPVEALMETIDYAVEHGFTVALDSDVSEKGFSRAGLAVLDDEALKKEGAITDDLRDQLFKSGDTTDDHLMHIVGIAKHKDGERYYLVKNSWGKVGPYDGNWMMARSFVALKTLAIMVHKDGVPPAIREKLGL
ncbi:MAG: C1 family peptidase [Planctomycetota bacterium]